MEIIPYIYLKNDMYDNLIVTFYSVSLMFQSHSFNESTFNFQIVLMSYIIFNLFQIYALFQDQNDFEISSQSSRTSSPDVADSVVLRHDPQPTNGNIYPSTARHTIGN